MSDILSPIEEIRNSLAWNQFLQHKTNSSAITLTPIVRSHELARIARVKEVFFKAEYLQRGGSFKIRGAMHKLSSLLDTPQKPDIFTASAGNHGIGLSLAARELNFKASVYVPVNTPQIKQAKIREAGATLCLAGADFDESESIAKSECEARGGVYVSSFDDEYIIAGNGGTLAREIDQVLDGARTGMDLIVPVGGGGLASGLSAYFYGTEMRLFGVEPENNCALTTALANNVYEDGYSGQNSCADGLAGAISSRTFELCQQGLQSTVTVSEAEILHAIGWAYDHLGIVIEGSAAASIAALIQRKANFSPRVCLVLTGANIDSSLVEQARNQSL